MNNNLPYIVYILYKAKTYNSMAKVEKLVPFILQWEGGFVNDPYDLGGATNKGVTIATYNSYRKSIGKPGGVENLKKISTEDWTAIMKNLYWDRWKADSIENQSVANVLVDWVWASGVHGIKSPQRLLKVAADGLVGKNTINAVNAAEPHQFFNDLIADRIKFVDEICKARPANERFRRGWLNRINSFKYE